MGIFTLSTLAPEREAAPAPLPSLPIPVPPQSGSMIEARGLVKRYRGRTVVDHVNLHVRQGEIVGLLGGNGAGKTTTFYMITGLVRPGGGKVLLNERDITREPMYKRARRGIGYLAQEASVFRKLTVRENILLVLELRGTPRGKRQARANQLMEEMGIEARASTPGYALSGGERRRVEFARALAADPLFLLLDEPFAGVDQIAIKGISDTVRSLRDRNIGVLITDHNAQAMLRLTERVYIMGEGKILTEGTPEVIAQDPLALEHYLGEDFRL